MLDGIERAKGGIPGAEDQPVEDGPLAPAEARPPWSRPLVWDRRGLVLRRLSVIVDMLAMLVAGGMAILTSILNDRPIAEGDVELFLLFVPLWPVIGIAMRAYHPHSAGRGLTVTIADELLPVFVVTTMWSWFFLVARLIADGTANPSLLPSLVIWILAIPLVLVSRSFLRRFAWRRRWYQQRALVIGRQSDSGKVISRIARHPEWGLVVGGMIDSGKGIVSSSAGSEDAESLLTAARDLEVSRVIFATSPGQIDVHTDLTRVLIESGFQVDFVPSEAEILRAGAELSDIEGLPLVSMPSVRPPRSRRLFKRGVDLCLAVPALVLVSPLLALAILRIRLDSTGGAFYRQPRAGLDGRPFEVLKLRTMVADVDKMGNGALNLSKDRNDPRVTKVGSWLRRSSIDELPQLWNVIKGEMSLVGPRPLPLAEDALITDQYEIRRHVRPGMTGLWQVSGRSEIPFEEMLRLDYSYALNWSLAVDIKVLARTIGAVLGGRGAY